MLSGNSDYSIQVSSNIVLGETATATLVGRDNAPLSESTQVEWSSRDNNVISVSGDGPTATLTAESLGNATIVASINGETVATQTVTAVETAVGVAAIRVSQEEITILRRELHHQRHRGDGGGVSGQPRHHPVEQQQHLRGHRQRGWRYHRPSGGQRHH